jgi:hypothetical protein
VAISDFLDCMAATVIREPFSSLDKYGERSFGAGVPIPARVQYREERVTIASGEEQVARGRVYLGELTGIQPEDKITLPDGETPEILAVRRVDDEDGPHHEVVLFK